MNNEWLIQVDRNEISLCNDYSIAEAVRNVILMGAHFSYAHIPYMPLLSNPRFL